MSADPIVVIMGPTASGKSALALELARKRGGEIVSVDSMQLYRGLEIGTAQPTAEEQMEIPHHLVGCFDFHERIDVFMFQRLADAAIAEIRRRGRLPVLAGGTGLYLRALLYGLDDLPADPGLRQELDAAYDSEAGETALKRRMAELDPAGLARWENCRRRLIRALEVRLLTGKSILELQKNPFDRCVTRSGPGRLDPEPEVLRERIARRARRDAGNRVDRRGGARHCFRAPRNADRAPGARLPPDRGASGRKVWFRRAARPHQHRDLAAGAPPADLVPPPASGGGAAEERCVRSGDGVISGLSGRAVSGFFYRSPCKPDLACYINWSTIK